MLSSLTNQSNSAELEEGDLNAESLGEEASLQAEDNGAQGQENDVLEPYQGMEFDSEDDARRFYTEYAKRVGFVVRLMQRRLSEIDGSIVARRLGCNKQGFASSTQKITIGPERKPRASARQGCNATILVRMDEKSRKWVCTRFEKEHNHPLVVTAHESTNMDDKDKKIQELTRELQRQDELCAAYKERLINLMATIDNQSEHLSSKVQIVVENMKKAEAETLVFRSRVNFGHLDSSCNQ